MPEALPFCGMYDSTMSFAVSTVPFVRRNNWEDYYAYWKDDNGKLKKYIGKYPPSIENRNKTKSSDMVHAASDTVIDTSNSTEEI